MKKLVLAVLLALFAMPAGAKIIKVDASLSASGTHDGINWITAFVDLQSALDNAAAGDDIWLAGGVYKPNRPSNIFDPRTAAFWTFGGIKIFGGFNQSTNNYSFATRDPAQFVTTLSGDIGVQGYAKDNAYCIIKTYAANGFAVLDGVTVYGAYDNNGFGGGIYLNSVSATINNCIFANNYTAQGAAIFCDNTVGASNASISSCAFNYNVAGDNGVYFYIGVGTSSVLIPSQGGAIFVAGSSPSILACTFSGNSAGFGSAICSETKFIAASPYIANCTFSNQAATIFAFTRTGVPGSVIRVANGLPTVTGCTFTNNDVVGFQGSGCAGQISNSTFLGGKAGAVQLASASTRVANCSLRYNSNVKNTSHPAHRTYASGRGGALEIQGVPPSGPPIIQNCLFQGNLASYGGGLSAYYGIADVVNCTFVENTALGDGGGIYQEGRPYTVVGPQAITQGNSSASFSNCIFSGNAATSANGGDDVFCQTTGVQVNGLTQPAPFTAHQATFRNSLIGTYLSTIAFGMDLGGNIKNASPKFVNALVGNFQLSSCSRCVDGGTNALPVASPGTDLLNNTRIFNGTVDMGCYERQSAPSAIYNTLSPVNVCAGGSASIFGVTRSMSGTYSQLYTAANGCDSVVSVVFTVRPAVAAVAAYSNNCGTTGTISLTPTAGTAPFSLTLNAGTQSTSGAAVSYTGLSAGAYTYSVTDANSCTSSASAALSTYNVMQNTLYVNAAATGSNSGLSWANAFTDLQSALSLAATCNVFTQIWVSEGTYVPSRDPLGAYGLTQTATFRMYSGLAVLGGFSTAKGHTTLALRNWKTNRTILSGDVQRDANQTNNAYNVVNNYNTGIDTTAVLDGFTVADAWNNITGLGGGIINYNSSPSIRNCTIANNFAGGVTDARGAGIYNWNAAPIISGCTFFGNNASGTSTAYGGAISNLNSSPRISHCSFDGNLVSATYVAGGAMYSRLGSPVTIANSLFTNNNASAICSDSNSFSMSGCTVTGNSGSATAPGGLNMIGCAPAILNSIIYGNANGSVANTNATPSFFYCDVEGSGAPLAWVSAYGANFGANLDKNPMFNAGARLSACSPAKDAGTFFYGLAPTDLDSNTRLVGGAADMGCFEYQSTTFYSGTVYVDAVATGLNNGTSWANAFTDLQQALEISSCFPVTQIWVSKGTYVPSRDRFGNIGGERLSTFTMRNGVTIYGGFSTANSVTTLAARNWNLYPAYLSADIQRDSIPTNNAYNVVSNYNNGVDTTATLDGLTITGAYNTYSFPGNGGISWGGGVLNVNTSPRLMNCTISGNVNISAQSAVGGGMYTKKGAPRVYNCKFLNNTTSAAIASYGAGVANDSSAPVFRSCVFDGNVGYGPNVVGAGMYSFRGAAGTIDNSRFTNNLGGAFCTDGNVFSVSNTTIANNTGGPSSPGGLFCLNANPAFTNSIVWGNGGGNVTNISASPSFFYCDVQGSGAPSAWVSAYGGNYGANLDADPLLDQDFGLYPCSPAINAASISFIYNPNDLAGAPRNANFGYDMGAYEYQGLMPGAYAGSIYVDSAATGLNNGSSWANAFTGLQQALDVARCGGPWQILVAKGAYYPTRNTLGHFTATATATFQMRNGVALYGGFSPPNGATTLANRNISAYRSRLSGDIQRDGDASNNAFTVISNGTGLDSSAVLDGFTVNEGYNNLTGVGGGIINSGCSPKFLNCDIVSNFAGGVADARGAGMYNLNAAPILRGCTFFNNYTSGIATAYGGGMASSGSKPKLSRCRFIYNTAVAPTASGSGMYSQGAGTDTVSVDNSLFANNVGSAAIGMNGALHLIANATITANSGSPAGGIHAVNSSGFIVNSIIWGNTGGSVSSTSSAYNFFYSDVQGSGGSASWNTAYGINFGANLDADPQLDVNLYPASCSPAVNTATASYLPSSTDLAGNGRTFAFTPDMGCYEVQEVPSAGTAVPLYQSTQALVRIQSATTHFSNCDSLLATVTSSGASPASGAITASVYVQPTAPSYNSQPYVRRNYDITPATSSVANSGTATIVLYFTQADFNDYNANRGTFPALPTGPSDAVGIAAFRITQQHGASATGAPGSYTGWAGSGPANVLHTPSLAWNAGRSRWEASMSVTGFSGFFASGSTGTPLPIYELRLSGVKEAGYNRLAWQAKAQGLTGFEVEAGEDGAAFARIAQVAAGAAATTGEGSFEFQDYVSHGSRTYYRIKALDATGAARYSNVVSLGARTQLGAVSIAPVPAADKVTLRCENAELVGTEGVVYDATGRLIHRFTIAQSVSIDVKNWTAGVYSIRLPDGTVLMAVRE